MITKHRSPRPLQAMAAALLALGLCLTVSAQQTAPTTAPTAPTTQAEPSAVDVIARHIEENSEDGVYRITDPRSGEELALSLAEIHTGAHPVESGEVYHCADFTDSAGTLYDLDMYVGERDGTTQVVEVLIHKAGGQERLR